MISMADVHWTAGFLEGEGSFCRSSNGGMRVSAAQANQSWEPIDRLKFLFGGRTYDRLPTSQWVHATLQRHWHLSGPMAVGLMMTLYPLLSPRRKGQIHKALRGWRHTTGRNQYKAHCSNGHVYEKESFYVDAHGHRVCRRCWKVYRRPRSKDQCACGRSKLVHSPRCRHCNGERQMPPSRSRDAAGRLLTVSGEP